jgi:hypothetical protein
MKKKPFTYCLVLIACSLLFTAAHCFGNNAPDTLKMPPGPNGPINDILGGIKTAKDKALVAEAALGTAQTTLDAKKPDLADKKNEKDQEALSIYKKYNNVFEEGSPEHVYWSGKYATAKAAALDYQGQIDNLQTDVDNAQRDKEQAESSMKELQQQLLDFVKLNSNLDCAKQLSVNSPVEAIVQCWNCLFDNNCGNYGPPPFSHFDINGQGVPIKNSGAPPIMGGAFRNQQLQDLSNGIEKIKVPPPPPPQKGVVEQATEKVRELFRNVINNSQRIKQRITAAVLAVRG